MRIDDEFLIRQELYKAIMRSLSHIRRQESTALNKRNVIFTPSHVHFYWHQYCRRQSHFRAATWRQCTKGGCGGWRWGGGVKIGEDKMECQTWLHYYQLFMDQTEAALALWDWLSSDWTAGRLRDNNKAKQNKTKKTKMSEASSELTVSQAEVVFSICGFVCCVLVSSSNEVNFVWRPQV